MKTFEALSPQTRSLLTAWLFILAVALRLTDATPPALLWLLYGLLAGATLINLKHYFKQASVIRQ